MNLHRRSPDPFSSDPSDYRLWSFSFMSQMLFVLGGIEYAAAGLPGLVAPHEPALLEEAVVHPDGAVFHQIRVECQWTDHGRNTHYIYQSCAR